MNDERLFDGEKLREMFIKNAGYIIAAFIAIAYIATSLITVSETGKSVAKIIGDGAQAFLAGVLITNGLSLQGISKGMSDKRVQEAQEKHSTQVLKVEPYIDELDDWCDQKTAQALRRERTKVLAACSMRYTDCFDGEGIAKLYEPLKASEGKKLSRDEKKREKARYRCYKRAVSLTITPLSASVLTGGRSKTYDPYDFGEDASEFERNNMKRDIISKLLVGVVFGYYAVEMLMGISLADTVWKVFQVCVFCGGGIVQMMRSFMYMIDGYCKRLDQLTGRLREFEVSKCGKGEESLIVEEGKYGGI